MERMLLLLAVMLLYSSVSVEGLYTYVNAERGNNDTQCINGGISYPCQTLGYVAEYISNHSTKTSSPFVVKIQDLEVKIDKTIVFKRAVNLTLEGCQDPTELVCTCKSSINETCGLIFDKSQGLIIKFLTFKYCRVEDTVGGNFFTAAVTVSNCKGFVLEKSKFINSHQSWAEYVKYKWDCEYQ